MDRLAIGACSSADDGVADDQRMEVYFATALTTECPHDYPRAVRDGLVFENSAQFGFDIVENDFRDDIFEFYADECGTNIYEVQSEHSEDTGTLETTVSGVQEFATSLRQERSNSWSASVSAEYDSLLASASAKVSASADQEQKQLLETTGANSYDSQVFTSLGVRRIAEVELPSFEHRFKFISFNKEFGNLLIAYRNEGYSKERGYEIISRYGQFVLTRYVPNASCFLFCLLSDDENSLLYNLFSGLYGGYLQFQSTIEGSEVSSSLNSEEALRQCYEASVKVDAEYYGFSGSASGTVSGCEDEELTNFEAARNTYQTETSQEEIVGAQKSYNPATDIWYLDVQPEMAVLLKDTNM